MVKMRGSDSVQREREVGELWMEGVELDCVPPKNMLKS